MEDVTRANTLNLNNWIIMSIRNIDVDQIAEASAVELVVNGVKILLGFNTLGNKFEPSITHAITIDITRNNVVMLTSSTNGQIINEVPINSWSSIPPELYRAKVLSEIILVNNTFDRINQATVDNVMKMHAPRVPV